MNRLLPACVGVFLLLAGLSPPLRAEPVLAFERLPAQLGLNRGFIQCMRQTRDGLLWFGKTDGLFAYDGRDMRVFPLTARGDQGVLTKQPQFIEEDALGRLWLGGDDGVLQVFERDANRFVDVTAAAKARLGAPLRFYAALTLASGDVLIAHGHGLARVRLGSLDIQPVELASGPVELRSLAQAGGRVYLGTGDGRILAAPGEAPERAELVHQAERPEKVTAMLTDEHGVLYAAVQGLGIYRLAGEEARSLWRHDSSVFSMALAGRRLFWTSANRGLWHQDLDSGMRRNEQNRSGSAISPSSNNPRSVLVARDGTLWLGHQGGGADKAVLGQGGFTLDQNPAGELSLQAVNRLNSLWLDAGGGLWLGTGGGGVQRFAMDSGRYQSYLAGFNALLDKPAATELAVRQVSPGPDGWLWIVSARGMFRLEPGSGRIEPLPLLEPAVAAVGRPYRVRIDGQGRIWLSSLFDKGMAYYEPRTGQTRHFPAQAGGLASPLILDLYDDGPYLWVLTWNAGLQRLDKAAERFLDVPLEPEAPGLEGGTQPYQLHRAADGRLWLAAGTGLYRLDEAHGPAPKVRRYISSPSRSLSFYSLAEDAQGRFWLGSSAGLVRFDPRREEARFIGSENGVPDMGYGAGAALRAPDGTLWFGTYQGLLRVDPAKPLRHAAPAPLLLRQYQLDGQVVEVQQGRDPPAIQAAYDNRLFRFRYAALDYATPEKTRYRYRLAGFEADWRDNGTRHEVTFTNLPPGDYRLEVQAAVDGAWQAAGPGLALSVPAAPWRTPWAYAAYAAGLLFVSGRWAWLRHRRRREERLHTESLRLSEERLSLALSGADAGIWDANLATGEVFRAGLQCLGYDLRELAPNQEALLERMHPDDRPVFLAACARLLSGESRWMEADYRLRSGEDWLWVRDRGQIVGRDGFGQPVRISGTLTNIQAQKEAEARLRRLATEDSLTRLPNRLAFQDLLDARMRGATAAGCEVALLFIDLDRFKHINDAMGHQFGDQVLAAVAERLRGLLPGDADGARIGGDEFTVILSGSGIADSARRFAGELLEAFRRPVRVNLAEALCTPSIGIAVFPRQAIDANTLIQCADTAMYHAKARGRNRYEFYDEVMAQQIRRRLALEKALVNALATGEFALYFQPKRVLASGEVHAAEVLMRWFSAELGAVSPAEFIPVLEDTGLIDEVGRWLLAESCRIHSAWRAAGLPAPRLAVNVSMRQIADPGFSRELAGTLQETGLPPACLELELTESMATSQPELLIGAMRQLKALGVSLAIDDFGTGFSNFSYLNRLPIDTLKIDKSFIDPIASDEDAATVCQAMIAMAHTLRLRVVAEGVETEAQHQLLLRYQSDEEQGFLFCKPLSEADMTDFLKKLAEGSALRASSP